MVIAIIDRLSFLLTSETCAHRHEESYSSINGGGFWGWLACLFKSTSSGRSRRNAVQVVDDEDTVPIDRSRRFSSSTNR